MVARKGLAGRKDCAGILAGGSLLPSPHPNSPSLHVCIIIILWSSMGNLIWCRPLPGCVSQKAKNGMSSYRDITILHAEYYHVLICWWYHFVMCAVGHKKQKLLHYSLILFYLGSSVMLSNKYYFGIGRSLPLHLPSLSFST